MAELSHRLRGAPGYPVAQSGWCKECGTRVTSTCTHVPMNGRQRRRLAAREARR